MASPKKIGFLSFGAWHPGGALSRNGGDALRQTVELASDDPFRPGDQSLRGLRRQG
jgi:hypothetical protein